MSNLGAPAPRNSTILAPLAKRAAGSFCVALMTSWFRSSGTSGLIDLGAGIGSRMCFLRIS